MPTAPAPARRILHPGPPHPERQASFTAPPLSGDIRLRAGEVLMDAIAATLQPLGIRAAALELAGLQLGPMDFVMPTFSKSPEHVAYYSETHHRPGPVIIEAGTATYGSRDGAPFLHGHVLWQDDDGKPMGGHLLPFDCRIGRDCTIRYTGCREIEMRAEPDAETNFTLFGPLSETASQGDLVVARIRPNEDLHTAIRQIARRHDIRRGRILSLIGSTVGARFEDGTCVDAIPTELLALSGQIETDASGDTRLDLLTGLIDADGRIHRGRLIDGENPVLILAELFIERLPPHVA